MNLQFWNRTFWGLVLIALGVLFLFHQLDMIEVDLYYLISLAWPSAILLFGLNGLVWNLRSGSGSMSIFVNFIIILIGLNFLLQNLGWFSFGWDFWSTYFIPLLLIAFGLSMLLKSSRKDQRNDPSFPGMDGEGYRTHDGHTAYDGHAGYGAGPAYGNYGGASAGASQGTDNPGYAQTDAGFGGPGPEAEPGPYRPAGDGGKEYHWHHDFNRPDKVQRFTFFGDVRIGQGPEYWELQPMEIAHFIGDTVIDLTNARIPAGETRLSISAFIGDTKVFLPADLQAEVRVVSQIAIGDIKALDRAEGGLFRQLDTATPYYRDAERKLLIHVNAFIGDVRVQRIG